MTRPASITVLGILNIVFGVFGLFGTVASVAVFALVERGVIPVAATIQNSPVYSAWVKLSIPLGLAACAALLAAGIGLLQLKSWARKLSIGYAIYAIVSCAIGLTINFSLIIPTMFKEAAGSQAPAAIGGAIGGAVGGAVGGCLGLVYPVLLLVFMLRATVVAAFPPHRARGNAQPRIATTEKELRAPQNSKVTGK
ncbi:MAG: hypothetical protein HQ546_11670 [Planctomycetes bacterium]|nr:hypothetical protein [Planctomycetota bacterium]